MINVELIGIQLNYERYSITFVTGRHKDRPNVIGYVKIERLKFKK